jgi:hypothetical protein
MAKKMALCTGIWLKEVIEDKYFCFFQNMIIIPSCLTCLTSLARPKLPEKLNRNLSLCRPINVYGIARQVGIFPFSQQKTDAYLNCPNNRVKTCGPMKGNCKQSQ